MAVVRPDPQRTAGPLFGAIAGAVLAFAAVVVWDTGNMADLAMADVARASQATGKDVLIEGTLVPDRVGPLFHSPATGEGALAYEILYFTTVREGHGKPRTTQVERQFASMPLVIRTKDQAYRLKGEVTTLHTREQQVMPFVAPQGWFPRTLRQTYPSQPFVVREARLEPGDTLAVRGRLVGSHQDVVVPREGVLVVWDGGLAPFEKARTERRYWAVGLGALALGAAVAPWWLRRRRPADPYEGWKVFR